MELKRPLYKSQIEAAKRLHDNLNEWTDSERVLNTISNKFPKFDKDSMLIKSVIINTLYSTNVMAIARMAVHLNNVIGKIDINKAGPELVEKMALLPRTKSQIKVRRFHSFSAKFAHFFIDNDKFPILDSYAEKMLKYHLGNKLYRSDRSKRYMVFIENLNRLYRYSELKCSYKLIDHYFWIAGQYHRWLKKPDGQVNIMLKELFSNPSGSEAKYLKQLINI